MKPLPNIDIEKCYGEDSNYNSTNYSYSIGDLIKKIEEDNNPVSFRNKLLGIVQLYFDGIVESTTGCLEERVILYQLCLAGKNAIGSFYRGEGINFSRIKEIVMPNAAKIIKDSSKKAAKYRHLTNEYDSVYNFGKSLKLLEDSPDTIACVASGGFEPSFLAMDILEKDFLMPLRYSRLINGDREVKVPTFPEEYFVSNIRNKKVLVIEDIVCSGISLEKVIKYLLKLEPENVYGCTVQGKITPNIFYDLNLEIFNKKFFRVIL